MGRYYGLKVLNKSITLDHIRNPWRKMTEQWLEENKNK